MQRRVYRFISLFVLLALLLALAVPVLAQESTTSSFAVSASQTGDETCTPLTKAQQATFDQLAQLKQAGQLDNASYDLFLKLGVQASCANTVAAPQSIEAISAYTFAQSSTTYTEITGGSTLGTATNDDTLFPNIALGFSFDYNGTAYTTVGVCSNGYVVMGLTTGTSCGSPYTPISSSTYNNVVSALGRDLQGNTTTGELRYETQGSAPNRTFTAQWKSYRKYNVSGDDFNFQITFHETSNVIEVKYGSFTVNATSSTPQVGIKGASTSDYNNRTTTTDWSASTAGSTNAATMTLSSTVKPLSGQTYTWTPPNFPPSITYSVLTNTASTANRNFSGVNITDVDGVNTTAGTMPRVYYKRSTDGNVWNDNTSGTDGWKYVEANGTSSPFDFTIDYSKLNGGTGVSVGTIVQYFVVAQDLAATPAVAINSGTFAAAPSSVALTAAAFPIGGTINSYTISVTYIGTYSVPGAFPSLTNAGGIFEALNAGVLTGNVTIEITADLTGELGTNALNQWVEDGAGGYTLTIKPSGAARTITGSNTGALIRLNGTDRVTINGSTTGVLADAVGGNPALRELTIQNTNTGTSAAVIVVQSGTSGAQNNTIKNINALGQDPTTTLIGIALGGNTLGTSGTDNDGNRVENCSIKRALFGIYSAGQNASNPNTGTVITRNDLSATGADRVRRVGILVFNENGVQITENSVGGIETNEAVDAIGIGVGTQGIDVTTTTSGGITNAFISHNKVNGVNSISTSGFSAAGITVAGAAGGANTIVNNMITGVTAPATSPDLVAGIFVAGVTSSNTNLYYNSVSLTGDRGAVASQMPSFGLAVTGTDPIVTLKDNIFYTTQTASGGGANAKSYAIGMVTTAFTNLDSNYNAFYSSGANLGGFRSGSLSTAAGTDYAALAGWQAAVSDDANSVEGDPVFVNPANDLHIDPNALRLASVVDNAGTPVAGVTTDFDAGARNATTPDIGGDEIGSTLAVTLSSLEAAQQGNLIQVTWETSTELNNRGFNLYRGTSPDGWDRQLNTTLIPSQAQGSPGGFVYTWDDQADLVNNQTYLYWLQDVSVGGVATLHGPISVTYSTPTAVTLNRLQAHPAASALPTVGAFALLAAGLAVAALRRRE